MVGTNSHIAKLKSQLDRAITQRDQWKQLAENRNSIVVTEVCPESRSVEEYIIDADSVRSAWRLIRGYREQIEALRLQNAMFATAAANTNREREALHAEAEALRAENGRLSQQLAQSDAALRESRANDMTNVRTLEGMWERHDALRQDLEAARGLLHRASAILGSQGFGAWDSLAAEIDALLTATPAPEVRCQTCDGTGDVHRADGEWLGECHCAKAEQGGRQEAVARVGMVPGTDFKSLDFIKTDLQDLPAGTKLYTTPQPGPDVQGLVEALEQADEYLSHNKLNEIGSGSILHRAMQEALAARRQAQRQAQQGGSHDT